MVSRLVDWDEYKSLCDGPELLSRWMIEQTVELLAIDPGSRDLRARLENTLLEKPLRKPVDHRGGPLTDMFRLSLSVADATAVLQLVKLASTTGQTTSATTARGLGGFVAAWAELVRHLIGRAPGGRAPGGRAPGGSDSPDVEAGDARPVP